MHIANIDDQLALPQDRNLLTLYRKAASKGIVPHVRLLTGEIMRELGDDLTVVERLENGDFRYLFYGDSVRDITGVDYRGQTTAQQPPKTGAQARRSFCQVLDAMAPVYSIDRASENGRVHLWGRLHFPFRDAEGRMLVVTINRPREYTDDLLREVLDAAADGIIAVRAMRNAEGEVTDCAIIAVNAPMAEFLQTEQSALSSMTLLGLFPHFRGSDVWQKHLNVIETRKCVTFESKHSIGGADHWYRVVSTPLNDGLVISYTDITELKLLNLKLQEQRSQLETEMARRAKIEQELWHLANIDPLTGVSNRRSMQEHALATLLRARKDGVTCAMIALDIDYFKRINDTWGHTAGDIAICAVADIIKTAVRNERDIVARMGGEEFALLLYNAGVETGMAVAERLRLAIEAKEIIVDGVTFSITVSFGVAISSDTSSYESLLKSADNALYCAKRAGRNRAELNEDAVAA